MVTKFFTEFNLNQDQEVRPYCVGDVKKGLLVKHRVSEEQLDYMIGLFFSPQTADPKTISRNDIDAFMDGKTCLNDQIDLFVDYSKTNNNDIALTTPDGPAEFSFALFEAILAQYNPDAFLFSMAINSNGNTIAFKVIKKIGGIEKVVYCADLSDVYP
jgi:hypothetical protein